MTENYTTCTICAGLTDKESAFQKYGWEDDNTYLPAAAGQIQLIKDFKPNSSRARQLQQCPECKTYYLYETDYEYLANGSEDEEYLTRLSDQDADAYLQA